jgi:hypothetical protein
MIILRRSVAGMRSNTAAMVVLETLGVAFLKELDYLGSIQKSSNPT